MKQDTLIRMLISIRDLADAILEELTDSANAPTVEPAKCEHPMDYRLNLSVLGSNEKRYRCKLCDYEWVEKPDEAKEVVGDGNSGE